MHVAAEVSHVRRHQHRHRELVVGQVHRRGLAVELHPQYDGADVYPSLVPDIGDRPVLWQRIRWDGDWQMPDGVQQADIDPATGEIAKADSATTTKRCAPWWRAWRDPIRKRWQSCTTRPHRASTASRAASPAICSAPKTSPKTFTGKSGARRFASIDTAAR